MNEQMKNKIEKANSTAIERVLKSTPVLVDIRPAIEFPKHEKEFNFSCHQLNGKECVGQ